MDLTESSVENLKPFRVLSLDGGGMRGLYTAVVLRTLMRRYLPTSEEKDRDIGKAFDLIVGTSTGGILATALAHGAPADRIVEFYSKYGAKIFPDPKPPFNPKRKFFSWLYRNINKPSGDAAALKNSLQKIFEEETVLKMFKRRGIALCLPTINISKNKAWIFKTPHIPLKNRDNGRSLVDICLATSAAPIFLPLASMDNTETGIGSHVFVDGGLWANNPVLIGLIEALEMAEDSRPIEILSIGTCAPQSGESVSSTELGRGLMHWHGGAKIVETAIDAQASGHHEMARFLANKLTKLGKKCSIVRLVQGSITEAEMQHLGLDKANIDSIQTLSNLGVSDGEAAHSSSLSEQNFIKSIFTNLPAFPDVQN